MLIACISIGDITVTCNAVQSLDPKDEMQFSYETTYRDGPTGVSETIVWPNENTMLSMLAAWINADEIVSSIKQETFISVLYGKLGDKAKYFMP